MYSQGINDGRNKSRTNNGASWHSLPGRNRLHGSVRTRDHARKGRSNTRQSGEVMSVKFMVFRVYFNV